MIHVAYRLWGGDGFYAKMLGVSMLSMFENTKEKVTVHVMHNDRLTPDNRGKLCYIAEQYNQRVEFHNVEEIARVTFRKLDETRLLKSEMNASWYPLVAHEVFPNLDKIILLGTDTVFNLDVAEMWAFDLNGEGYEFAAVPEVNAPATRFGLVWDKLVEKEDYFNSDVLIASPKFFAENFQVIWDACKFVGSCERYSFYEQDALNYAFSKKYLKLPYRFNAILADIRRVAGSTPIRLEKALYHYAGAKPEFDTDDVFNKLYWEYFLKTPWVTADMFGRIDKALKEIESYYKTNFLYFTNLLAYRKRAFFVDNSEIDSAKRIFHIKDDELLIDASTPHAGGALLNVLARSNGEKFFIIKVENYPYIREVLEHKGFAEGIDFIDARLFSGDWSTLKGYYEMSKIACAL